MEGYFFNVCGFNSDYKCERKRLLSISQNELHPPDDYYKYLCKKINPNRI